VAGQAHTRLLPSHPGRERRQPPNHGRPRRWPHTQPRAAGVAHGQQRHPERQGREHHRQLWRLLAQEEGLQGQVPGQAQRGLRPAGPCYLRGVHSLASVHAQDPGAAGGARRGKETYQEHADH